MGEAALEELEVLAAQRIGSHLHALDLTHHVARAALEERTRELERERELTAAQAVALDRVRIARELHDVVAHHVSAMGVQAGAARAVLDSLPIDQAMADRIVEEANHAFHLNMTMFQELVGNLIAAIGKVLFGFLTRRQRSGSTEVAAA